MPDETQYKTEYNGTCDFLYELDGLSLEDAIEKLKREFAPREDKAYDGTLWKKFPEGAKNFRLHKDTERDYGDSEGHTVLRVIYDRPKTHAELMKEGRQRAEQKRRELKMLHDLQYKYGKKREGKK